MVAVLRALASSRKDLTRSVTIRLGEHPDGKIFTSLPRSGQINAAQMLAEWGDCREAYDSADAVTALAGLTPVTKESGEHRAVRACSTCFRVAVTTFADNNRHVGPWAAAVYAYAAQARDKIERLGCRAVARPRVHGISR